jgi:NAD(P)-dependent dehydrogenase (short-subunit alcohol dehydrogenase family)
VWRSIKAVTPHMIQRNEGSIVITASTDALEPGGGYTHYTAAKHGVLGVMKSVALELAPHGIRANAICPGVVDTPMMDNQLGYDLVAGRPGGGREDLLEGGYHFAALKGVNVLEPERIAHSALYLNSELAARVTGVTLSVDAGHMLLGGYNWNPMR